MPRKKTYKIKEAFLTVQGEGVHAGTPAVFVRFAGCNFWSGRAEDKAASACPFCDTNFVGTDGDGGGRFTVEELASHIEELSSSAASMVVFTGGEPLLQLDGALVSEVKARGFYVAVETNGSIALPEGKLGIDWVCCSPKVLGRMALTSCSELKVIYPAQEPLKYARYFKGQTRNMFVQPEDGSPTDPPEVRAAYLKRSTEACLKFVHENRGWRISVQTHKMMGVR